MHLQLYFRAVGHLSDARFASAAGAEFIGFPWYPTIGDGISPADYLDIRQWISGPVPVLQIQAYELGHFSSIYTAAPTNVLPPSSFSGIESDPHSTHTRGLPNDAYSSPASDIVPEAIEVTTTGRSPQIPNIRPECPVLWKIDVQQQLPALFRAELDYLVLDPGVFLRNTAHPFKPADLPKDWVTLFGHYRCFLEIPFNIQNPMEWVETFKPFGLSLSGQPETAVGKRDYSAWQDFTDLLEDSGLR